MLSKRKSLKFFLLLGDIFLIFGTMFFSLALRYKDFSFLPGSNSKIFIFHFLFVAPLWLFLLYLLDFYRILPLKNIFHFLYNLVVFAFLAGISAVFYFYIQPKKSITPKTILALHVFLFSFFLALFRIFISKALDFLGVREKVLVLGSLQGLSQREIEEKGFEIEKVSGSNLANISQIQGISEKSGTIVIDPNLLKEKVWIKQVFEKLPLQARYVLFPVFYEEISGRVPLDMVDRAWFLQNIFRPETKIERSAKRISDIVLSFIGLVLSFPVCFLVALLIKISSPGPVFYISKRIGKEEKTIALYKFRTMVKNADKSGPHWTLKQDKRITRIGKFLRNSRLDEIPQLWNVLKGDLSFVGPRAEDASLVREFRKEIPFYKLRYIIKPGITGWAQINYPPSRSLEQAKRKFEYDLYYIKHRSLALDLSIMLKTARIFIRDIFNISG